MLQFSARTSTRRAFSRPAGTADIGGFPLSQLVRRLVKVAGEIGNSVCVDQDRMVGVVPQPQILRLLLACGLSGRMSTWFVRMTAVMRKTGTCGTTQETAVLRNRKG